MDPPFAAPASFMGVPQRAAIEGARAVILGLPFDCGAHPTRIGSRLGPAAIREQSRLVSRCDFATDLDPLAALGVIDVGDAPVQPGAIEPSFAAIERAVEAITAARAIPLSLGGDGAIALPEMRALSRAHPGLVTLHIDAHTDAYPIPGHTNATPFARAAEEGVVDAARSFQVGMRGSTSVPGVGAHGRALGYQVIPMEQLLAEGIGPSFAAIRRAIGERPVYLSYDMDFFDPSVAPGVCSPTFGGASVREGLSVLEACAGLNIVGMNINTVSPPHDPGGVTALLAATVAYRGLMLLAAAHQVGAARR